MLLLVLVNEIQLFYFFSLSRHKHSRPLPLEEHILQFELIYQFNQLISYLLAIVGNILLNFYRFHSLILDIFRQFFSFMLRIDILNV